jgi:FolB domain-containing protein
MIIRIKNLRLQTILGINDWERENKQDIVINIKLDFDGSKASMSDRIEDTVDYKSLKLKIIEFVDHSRFYLIEKLVAGIGGIIMEDEKVNRATIEIDKPHALRYADSVSIEYTVER